MLNMPSASPPIFPQQQPMLAALGERLRLARLRRHLTTTAVAQRAGISRTSLYKAERGDPTISLGMYVRILATMGLDNDVNMLAADDPAGRKLQDLALEPTPRARKKNMNEKGLQANTIKREQL